MIKTIAFDGDDTLWHHENFFAQGRDDFRDIMRDYTDRKGVRDWVDNVHIKNLGLFGYGVKSFTLSMIETAIEITDGAITADDIQRLLEIGKEMLKHPIILLEGVEKTVKTLCQSGDYRLMIITKGDLLAQEDKVARSRLADHFDHIEIVSEKNPTVYKGIFKHHKIDPASVLMIGNSIKSDILPVIQNGGQAIHIPYHTTWKFEKAELGKTEREQFLILESMSKLMDVIHWLEADPERQVTEFPHRE